MRAPSDSRISRRRDAAPRHRAVELHGHVEEPEADRAAPDRSSHQRITYPDSFSRHRPPPRLRPAERHLAGRAGSWPACCSSCATSASPAAGAGSSTRSAPSSRRAPPRSSAPRAAASRRCCGCSTASPIPTAARSPTAAARCSSTTRWRCGARSRWCRSCRRCWRGRSSRTSRYAAELAGAELDADRCLRLAGLDPGFAERDVAKLSVGEQQRAMLARALGQEPAVLLLDEPTSALDQTPATRSRRPWRELRRELEISLIVVSHDPEQARRLGDWACGSRRDGWSRPARWRRCWRERLDPRLARAGRRSAGPGRARRGDLLLAAGRSRARHRGRGDPLLRPADRDRLRDRADLRGGHDLAGPRAARR